MRGNLMPATVNLGNYLWLVEGKDSKKRIYNTSSLNGYTVFNCLLKTYAHR